MKNNPLDDIIKCDVEISSPGSSDVSFDSILLVVAGPAVKGTATISGTTAISKADELLDYGYKTDSPAYIAATVAFSQNPSPDELYIVVREKTAEKSTYEDVATTLARANSEASFYGIHLTEFRDSTDIEAAKTWTEANEKLYAFEYTDIDSCPVKNFSFYRTFGIFSGLADGYAAEEQPAENQYAALAWMAKCFGYDPGTETWNLKELATIAPTKLSTEQKKALGAKNINTFLRYAGCNCAMGGMTLAGEWIDVIRFRDWLKNELQIRTFNALKTNRKVPFTDGGIGLIEGVMDSTLKDGQDIGGIAPTEYDEKTAKKRWKEYSAQQMTELAQVLQEIEDFAVEGQEPVVMKWVGEKGYKLGDVMNAFRLALVGIGKGPGMFDISAFLGKEETLRRLHRAISELG